MQVKYTKKSEVEPAESFMFHLIFRKHFCIQAKMQVQKGCRQSQHVVVYQERWRPRLQATFCVKASTDKVATLSSWLRGVEIE